jgi:cytochrome c peroxidase
MARRWSNVTLAWLASLGCSSSAAAPWESSTEPPATDGSAPNDDGGIPTFTSGERALLATLSPATLPAPPPDPSNAHADDPAAAALGQQLFFDTGLSGKLLDDADDGAAGTLGTKGQTGQIACVSCHDPSTNFTDDRSPGAQISLGAAWGRRTARSLLDVGQASLLGWDGRHDALYNMAIGAFESPADMNSGRLFLAEQIYARYKTPYEAIFGPMPPMTDASRFPQMTADEVGCSGSVTYTPSPTCTETPHGVPGDSAQFDGIAAYADRQAVTEIAVNVGKAIGAYLRLLVSGPSRFDAWVHGQDGALSPSEQRGAQIFVGRGFCIACHAGPYFSDGNAHVVGLRPAGVSPSHFVDTNDQGAFVGIAQDIGDPLNVSGQFSDGNDGRLPASVDSSYNGAFFTPRLRGVALQPSFMHTGQFQSLAEVVAFFSGGGDDGGFPGTSELSPVGLSAQDQADLVAFLGSLTGPGPAPSLRSASP